MIGLFGVRLLVVPALALVLNEYAAPLLPFTLRRRSSRPVHRQENLFPCRFFLWKFDLLTISAMDDWGMSASAVCDVRVCGPIYHLVWRRLACNVLLVQLLCFGSLIMTPVLITYSSLFARWA